MTDQPGHARPLPILLRERTENALGTKPRELEQEKFPSIGSLNKEAWATFTNIFQFQSKISWRALLEFAHTSWAKAIFPIFPLFLHYIFTSLRKKQQLHFHFSKTNILWPRFYPLNVNVPSHKIICILSHEAVISHCSEFSMSVMPSGSDLYLWMVGALFSLAPHIIWLSMSSYCANFWR